MLKEEIKNVVIGEMFESCLGNVTVERILEGNLKADRSTILVNENKFLTYVPEKVYFNDEYIELHGHTRNSIAKEFIKRYTYQDIRKAFEKKLEKLNKHLQLEEENKHKLESLLQLEELKYFNNLKYNNLEVNFNYGIKKFYIEFRYTVNEYKSNIIEIFNNSDYNSYIFKNGIDKKIVNQNELIELLKGCINESIRYEEEKRKELEKEYQKQQRENQVLNKLMEILKGNEILFKNRNSYFVVVNGRMRYAVGKGKSGKYYKTDFYKVFEMILKKGIKEYYILKDDSLNLYDNEVLKSLNYSII